MCKSNNKTSISKTQTAATATIKCKDKTEIEKKRMEKLMHKDE